MDVLVDRLIERIEAVQRWAHAQARRGFDRLTDAMPWADQLVLRCLLAERGRQAWGWLVATLVLLGIARAQWAYHHRFVVQHDTWDGMFRVYWLVFVWFGMALEVAGTLWALIVLGILLARMVRWVRACPRDGTFWTKPRPWRAWCRQRWTAYRDREMARLRRDHPELLAQLEQRTLRDTVVGVMSALPSGPPSAPVRRRL